MMNTLTRYLVLFWTLFFFFLFTENTASAIVLKRAASSGSYAIYLTNPTTKEVTSAGKWAESSKAKVLTLCKSYLKTQKNYGILCLWNGAVIYSKKPTVTRVIKKTPVIVKKTPVKTPVIVKKDPVNTPVLPPAETRLFDGYIDGRIVLSIQDATAVKANETCSQMMKANPASEVMCRWGETILDTRLVAEAAKANQIELLKSTLVGSTGSYLSKDKEQEVGIFSLKSGTGNADARIESIVVNHIGSTRLRGVVDYDTSARLIDMDTGRQVTATVTINDTSISFMKMDEIFAPGATKNYKILLSINAMRDVAEYTTVALTIDPQNVKIIKKSDASRIGMLGGVLAMKSYIIGKKPPTIAVSNIGENLFRIKLTNTDENYPISLTEVAVTSQLSLPSGKTYAASACIRDIGSNQACGSNGATIVSVPGQSRTISLVGASMNTYAMKLSVLEVDLYVTSNDIFPTGGQVDITIDSVSYLIDGKTLTERFYGVSTAKSSYRK